MDYGLPRLSKGGKKRGKREMKERQKKKKEIEGTTERHKLYNAAVGLIWPSRAERHSFNPVLAGEVTLDPLHALPCSRCKPSLLGCSTTGTQRRLIFSHTLRALGGAGGGMRYENTASFHTSKPPLPTPSLPSCKFYCLGSNIQTCLMVWGAGGAAICSNQLFLL